jgi:NAD(P)-dependent dehydrogenase (short-subunit alcohol dehydrogenase family)
MSGAKHGVIGLTKAAALDYGGQDIRANAILPGSINTPMVSRANSDPALTANMKKLIYHHPFERFGEPREVGEAVKWLLSDAASFVTGVSLPVNGGFLAI